MSLTYSQAAATLESKAIAFRNNQNYEGGALRVTFGFPSLALSSVDSISFESNSATRGGAIYHTDGQITLNGGVAHRFHNNTALHAGGALWTSSYLIPMIYADPRTSFMHNKATIGCVTAFEIDNRSPISRAGLPSDIAAFFSGNSLLPIDTYHSPYYSQPVRSALADYHCEPPLPLPRDCPLTSPSPGSPSL